MKVLIMEDEVQIREGLAESISWEAYGITDVYTAKNGELGLEMARKYRPNIILTDIRMPRMDGISAVKRLRQILPQCSIIFISAYPEKNYFKEAIRLKAISFVEKPIRMEELKQTIEEAVQEQVRLGIQQEQEEDAYFYRGQQLVERLSRNLFENKEECARELEKAGIQGDLYSAFCTVLVRYSRGEDDADTSRWEHFCANNKITLQEAPGRILWNQKQPNLLVYHIFMKNSKELGRILEWMKKQLAEVKRWYILVGDTVTSAARLQSSYQSAVLMQNPAFYLPYGSVADKEEGNILLTLDFGNWKAKFTERVKVGRFAETAELLDEWRQEIAEHRQMHCTAVRELYLYLYNELIRYAEQNAVFLKNADAGIGMRLENKNYEELHEGLRALLNEIWQAGEKNEDTLVVHIKKCVQDNYRNPWFSIKEIAEAVDRSVSYICVTFKRETGITLNQYLTAVRLETAKALLDNPRNSIKLVAEESGYTDSSYFSRAFKKHTGLTPSEYRGEEK